MPTYNPVFEFDYAFLVATYDKYDASLGNAKGGGHVASPNHRVNLAAQYFHDFDDGTLSYRLEYLWQDEQMFTTPNQGVSTQGAFAL